jgi:hypothetical protein
MMLDAGQLERARSVARARAASSRRPWLVVQLVVRAART